VIAIALVFPDSDSFATTEYLVGTGGRLRSIMTVPNGVRFNRLEGRASNGRRIADLPASAGVYIAVDGMSMRHLLVRVPEEAALDTLMSRTRALDVRVDVLSVSGLPQERYVILACRDPAFHSLFDSLVSDVAAAVRATPADAGQVTLKIVDRWRRSGRSIPMRCRRREHSDCSENCGFSSDGWGDLGRTTLLGWQGPLDGNHDIPMAGHFGRSEDDRQSASAGPASDIESRAARTTVAGPAVPLQYATTRGHVGSEQPFHRWCRRLARLLKAILESSISSMRSLLLLATLLRRTRVFVEPTASLLRSCIASTRASRSSLGRRFPQAFPQALAV